MYRVWSFLANTSLLPIFGALIALPVVGCRAAIGVTVALFVASVVFGAGPVQDAARMGALFSFGAAALAIIAGRLARVEKQDIRSKARRGFRRPLPGTAARPHRRSSGVHIRRSLNFAKNYCHFLVQSDILLGNVVNKALRRSRYQGRTRAEPGAVDARIRKCQQVLLDGHPAQGDP
jgi:hypothetical protein